MSGDASGLTAKKLRALIKSKLIELDALVDEELPDYVMIMVANKKSHEQMARDLRLFLQENADSFTKWLTSLVHPETSTEVKKTAQARSEGDKIRSIAADGSEQSLELTAERDEFADELQNEPRGDRDRASEQTVVKHVEHPSASPTSATTQAQESVSDTPKQAEQLVPAATRPKAESSVTVGLPVQSVLTVPRNSRITLNRDVLRTENDRKIRPAHSRSRSRSRSRSQSRGRARPIDLRSKLANRHGGRFAPPSTDADRSRPAKDAQAHKQLLVRAVQEAEESVNRISPKTRTLNNTATIKPMPQNVVVKVPVSETPAPVTATVTNPDPIRPGLVTITLSPDDLKLLMEAKSSRALSPNHSESERRTPARFEPQFIVTLDGAHRTVADTCPGTNGSAHYSDSSLPEHDGDELDEAVKIIHAHPTPETLQMLAETPTQLPLRQRELAPQSTAFPIAPVMQPMLPPAPIAPMFSSIQPFMQATVQPPWNTRQPTPVTPFGAPIIPHNQFVPIPPPLTQPILRLATPSQSMSNPAFGPPMPPPLVHAPAPLAPIPFGMTVTGLGGPQFANGVRTFTQPFEMPAPPITIDAPLDSHPQPWIFTQPPSGAAPPVHHSRPLGPDDLRSKLSARKRRFDLPNVSDNTPAAIVDAVDEQRFTVSLCDEDDDVEDVDYPRAADGVTETGDNLESRPARNAAAAAANSSSPERCRFWPACKNGTNCPFVHPSEPCRNFPTCSFGDRCLFVHPTCKFDLVCTRPECPYAHTTPRRAAAPTTASVVPPAAPRNDAVTCRFFPSCFNPKCGFFHPTPSPTLDGSQPPRRCMYGSLCPNKAFCKYSHEPPPRSRAAPNRTLFKWIGAKTKSPDATPSTPDPPPNAGKQPLPVARKTAVLSASIRPSPSADLAKRVRLELGKPDSPDPLAEHDEVAVQ